MWWWQVWLSPFSFCCKRVWGSLGPRNIDGEALVGDSIHLTAMFIPLPEVTRCVCVCVSMILNLKISKRGVKRSFGSPGRWQGPCEVWNTHSHVCPQLTQDHCGHASTEQLLGKRRGKKTLN